MNNSELAGFHMSGTVKEKTALFQRFHQRVSYVQMFTGNPKSMSPPGVSQMEANIKLAQTYGSKVVFHSPYTSNLVRCSNMKTLEYTRNYVVGVAKILSGIKPGSIYVTHTGKSTASIALDKDTLFSSLRGISDSFYGFDNHTLIAVECDPGHKKDDSGACDLNSLYYICKELDQPQIGICLDTEHAYASGVDIYNIPEDYWNYIKVVHFNSIPSEVKFGQHLDRHSHTSLKDCTADPGYIEPIYKKCVERGIPMILERRDMEVVSDDLETMESLYSKNFYMADTELEVFSDELPFEEEYGSIHCT